MQKSSRRTKFSAGKNHEQIIEETFEDRENWYRIHQASD